MFNTIKQEIRGWNWKMKVGAASFILIVAMSTVSCLNTCNKERPITPVSIKPEIIQDYEDAKDNLTEVKEQIKKNAKLPKAKVKPTGETIPKEMYDALKTQVLDLRRENKAQDEVIKQGEMLMKELRLENYKLNENIENQKMQLERIRKAELESRTALAIAKARSGGWIEKVGYTALGIGIGAAAGFVAKR